MQTFNPNTEFIHLIQLLKRLNWVESGAVAKMVVDDNMVRVNGEIELRKRRKLVPGDIVEFATNKVTIGEVVEVEKPPKLPKPPKAAKPKSQVHPARRRKKPTKGTKPG